MKRTEQFIAFIKQTQYIFQILNKKIQYCFS